MMNPISAKSVRSYGQPELTKYGPVTMPVDSGIQHIDFEDFIEESCKKFECPISVAVGKEVIRDQASIKSAKQKQATKYKRKSVIKQLEADVPSPTDIPETAELFDEHTLLVMALYDTLNQLVEIQINKFCYQEIPRVLMQIIALKVPYTRQLSKFTIKQCRIDMFTIYELSKILLLTNITEVCLDHSPLKEGNYDILLNEPSTLRNLSLARCNINDIVCERIVSRLHHLELAEPTLFALNLSSNHITDVGAKCLGEALRSNRHLRYLNIADNCIGDEGARYIFDVLIEFPLTSEEIINKGKRYVKYLRNKNIIYNKYMQQFSNKTEEVNGKKSGKQAHAVRHGLIGKSKPGMKKDKKDSLTNASDEYLRSKANAMAEATLGPFKDPFCTATTTVKDGVIYCIGNFALNYLNLAYNNLTFQSVQTLLAVVYHQKNYRNLGGLLNVLIEGNYVPAECDEYMDISKQLNKSRSHLKRSRLHKE